MLLIQFRIIEKKNPLRGFLLYTVKEERIVASQTLYLEAGYSEAVSLSPQQCF
jgi:hypothetical protein